MTRTAIRFANARETEFVTKLRSEVNNYFKENNISRFGNAGMVVKTIFMFSLYFIPYLSMMTGLVTSTGMIVLCWALMGFGTAGIGLSIMHDANHRSYSKRQWVNTLLSYSLNLVGGFSPNWQQQHNVMHHSYTNIEGHDEDIDPGGILRFSPNSPWKKHHRFQHLYAWFLYGLMTLTWTTNKDIKQLAGYLKDGVVGKKGMKKGRLITELTISKILYFAYIIVLPIIFLPVPWWTVVLLYLMMHFISGFLLAVIFQAAHVMPENDFPMPDSDGNIENNWAVHQLMTTTDFAQNRRVFSWLIGGLNFQVEHHLFPTVCHVHYRKIAKIVRETAMEYQVPYHVRPSFVNALSEHYKMLKLLGQESRSMA
jgi:linoleoyl-CoA desaturase